MEVLKLLMHIRNPILDYFFMGFSHLSNPVVIIALVAWIYINMDKNKACGMGFALFLSGCVAQGAKLLFRVPRPWILESNPEVFAPVSMALSTATGYSFPSVHMQATTAFAESVFIYRKKLRERLACCLFLFLAAFSRMYLGCHTPRDILGAFFITTPLTVLAVWGWNRVYKNHRNDGLFAFAVLSFALLLLFLAAALTANGTVEPALSADGFKFAGGALGFAGAFLWERLSLRFCNEGRAAVKLLRFLVQLCGFLLLNLLLKKLLPGQPLLMCLRYLLLSFWMFGLAPWLCLKLRLLRKE